ncbi:plasmid partitioning protein RepB C-terminal domain-containing protein [Mesorhizobium sp.]|uniref:plasmid partitioning protein RepB C-terminal domain-containing protein n=1 Tax=Mesorhizobium sp. TaxID=1871066 RepID=UPI000FE3380F|nr:plasmid partitioning protein RepB C-terminal domain-containing protein [Mesorhizobium sp.]RWH69272.1 MAG: hypothetical protein EOQ84_21790 [Mesorhizobium sp.]RWL27760.1 MAG: hypothetical protein EOR58_13865 [Mesorhizobium sp.]RWL29068.1 MAG: hypothetical protein EOR63_18980 [Mesorhizobium sp.]RWL34812.1 MAG: hypothetical protein EOR59_23855 [Mesorhizobium sp.]RWL51569.1 MAG: hypothetical protein EOR62_20730 [Mesorhizobium sp.]
MTKPEAHFLKSSRHAIHLTGGLCAPAGPLRKYVFLRSLKKQNEEMRAFILEAGEAWERLDFAVGAFRELLAIDVFRDLLTTERLGVLPQPLLDRIAGKHPEDRIATAGADNFDRMDRRLPGGICPEVLDILSDCVVPLKMFGLLRQVVPDRQVEIAKVMIALRRVKLNTARVFVILTSPSQLTDPSRPRQQFPGIDGVQLATMESELADLSRKFQQAEVQGGIWNLELIAARGYILQLLESAKVVRYLAQYFPRHLSEFQKVLDFSMHVDPSIRRRRRPTPTPKKMPR